jgi:hypothetical protein
VLFADLKQNRYHIQLARLLLVIFVAGQIVLYGHQHQVNTVLNKVHSQSSQQTITEKCQLCDAMHFNSMVINMHYYVVPVVVSHYHYKAVTYSFVSLSLILSTGRAPPIS